MNDMVVISHESHKHPSQVVPYEGAATGVGDAYVMFYAWAQK